MYFFFECNFFFAVVCAARHLLRRHRDRYGSRELRYGNRAQRHCKKRNRCRVHLVLSLLLFVQLAIYCGAIATVTILNHRSISLISYNSHHNSWAQSWYFSLLLLVQLAIYCGAIATVTVLLEEDPARETDGWLHGFTPVVWGVVMLNVAGSSHLSSYLSIYQSIYLECLIYIYIYIYN